MPRRTERLVSQMAQRCAKAAPKPPPINAYIRIEFHDEKDWRKLRGPPRPTGYENAVIAVRMCKVKYEHPADLYVLKGVGPTCVERLVYYRLCAWIVLTHIA